MFCPKCGKQIPDSVRFCPVCGAQVGSNPPAPPKEVPAEEPAAAAPAAAPAAPAAPAAAPYAPAAPAAPAAAPYAPAAPAAAPYAPAAAPVSQTYTQVVAPPVQPAPKKKSKLGLILGLVGGGALLLVLLIVGAVLLVTFLLNRKVDIDLTQYATATFSGYDTIGTAEPGFDRDKFLEDFGKKIKYSRNYKGTYEVPAEDLVDNYLYYYMSYDDTNDLSNGDVVTYHLNPPYDLSEYFNVKNGDQEGWIADIPFTVSGLDKGTPFDPFEGILLSVEGTSPFGSLLMDTTDCIDIIRDNYMLEADKTNDLANGDVVTISVSSWYDNAYFLRQYGMYPTRTTMEYEVSDLPFYVSKLSDLPSDVDADLRAAFFDIANNWLNDGLKSNQSLANVTDIGRIFLSKKEPDSSGTNNSIYEVFRYNLSATSSIRTGTFTLYLVVRMDNLIMQGNEFQGDFGDAYVLRHYYKFTEDNWTVSGNYGFHTEKEILDYLVPSDDSEYNCERTFGEL